MEVATRRVQSTKALEFIERVRAMSFNATVLEQIVKRIEGNGGAMAVGQLCKSFGPASTDVIVRHVAALEREGVIWRNFNRIELL